MRLDSKDEQILHVYFVAKKKNLCFYYIYIYDFYFRILIYKWIK